MHQEGLPWIEVLPAVLCSMRASNNRAVGLSPHKIIAGHPLQMPGVGLEWTGPNYHRLLHIKGT